MSSSVRDRACRPSLFGWRLWDPVCLDEAATNIEAVLQLSARRIEGIVNCHVNILVGLLVVRHPADGNFITPGPDIDDDAEEAPFALVLVGRLDRDPATHDVVSKLFELLCVFANGSFNELGPLQVLETDL